MCTHVLLTSSDTRYLLIYPMFQVGKNDNCSVNKTNLIMTWHQPACCLTWHQLTCRATLTAGTGTIALRLAASNCCKQVTGFDVSQSAIAVAKCNAARNKITNANFVCGDLNQLAKGGLLGPGVKPDVVVVDPARGGLGRSVVNYLLNCGAKRLIYVSCNAATQARDLQLLCGDSVSDSFELRSCVAVDMYPQTGVEHVETVVVLDRHDV
eukprot:GHUV01024887.1.p1 GENE.GHUV01024887.1~~GHUV01024887.1.p1  ORF type:complete len:210 (+),score=24.18 GHUV01024887.1:462-1091(+)